MKRLLIFFALSSSAFAASPTPFATVSGVNGVAGASDKLIVTEYNSGNVDSIDSGGNVTVLATLPPRSGPTPTPTGTPFGENYVAIAPPASASATPAWIPGKIYVTQGADVYEVSTGTAILFTTISSCTYDHTGITFDTVGTFGNNMIVTCNNGTVWTVDSSGTSTEIGDFGASVEGPAVVPAAFGTYGGQILVGDEINGAVHAMDNLGNISYSVFSFPGSESVIVIPNPPVGFFQARSDNNTLYKFPSTDFTGLSGGIVIPSETGSGIDVVTWNGSSYDQATFYNGAASSGNLEGSAFAFVAASPTPTPTPTPALLTSAWGYIF